MAEEVMLTLVRQLLRGALHPDNIAAIDDLGTPEFLVYRPNQSPVDGTEALRRFVSNYRTALRSLSFTIEDLVHAGDYVAWRWTFRGTVQDEAIGVLATGDPIAATGVVISRSGGKRAPSGGAHARA
jgi:predicted ester cyclase